MTDEKQEIVSLIKPQFEAGKELVGKNGVVREKSTHLKVINDVLDYAENIGLYPKQFTFSPIKGPAGNIEYLVQLTNEQTNFDKGIIINTVELANNSEF